MLFRNILIFITMWFLMQACEKDPQPLTTNSMIRGNVYWYSENGEEGKVKVTAMGPYGSKSVETSDLGDFSIDQLGNGTYCIEFEKEGYGKHEKCDIQLFGNDTVRVHSVQLYSNPGIFRMPVLTRAYITYPDFYTPSTVPCITIDTDLENLGIPMQLKIFINSSSDVSWNNYQYVTSGRLARFDRVHNAWIIYISLQFPEYFPFQSGEKIYVRTYACNVDDPGYVDAYLGIMHFPTLDKSRSSNAIEFVMP